MIGGALLAFLRIHAEPLYCGGFGTVFARTREWQVVEILVCCLLAACHRLVFHSPLGSIERYCCFMLGSMRSSPSSSTSSATPQSGQISGSLYPIIGCDSSFHRSVVYSTFSYCMSNVRVAVALNLPNIRHRL